MAIRVSTRRVDMNGTQMRWSKGADIASASPLVLGTDGNYFDVTGTTGFSQITVAAGTLFMLQFDGALTLTNGANLILPHAANQTTQAGDRLIGFAEAANTTRVLSYVHATTAADRTALGLGTLPYDIAFVAGFDVDMVKENVAVATYGELVMARSGSFVGEDGYIDTAPTTQAVIADILKNAVTIYSTKPQFAASANTLTGGTLKTDGTEDFVSGDRITFKLTQIGSGTVGQGVRFTLKGET